MKRPVIIGEVLFDVVPGKEILGGAHFNVAWHLHALGLNPLLISRIGDDARGEIVLKTMREWGMDTSGIQIDTDGETTTTDCTVIDGKATYGICMGKAFDFIDAEQALNALGDSAISILFYGTLASRHAVSLAALEALVAKQPDIQFIDLNLRPPSYTDEQNQLFMQRADWLKLNDEELELISGQPCESRTEQEQAAQALQQQYAIENVLITCGEAGAFCVSNNGILSAKPEHYHSRQITWLDR